MCFIRSVIADTAELQLTTAACTAAFSLLCFLLLAGCRPHELVLLIDYIFSLGVFRWNLPRQLEPGSYLRGVSTGAVS